jgi:hypothetical protein
MPRRCWEWLFAAMYREVWAARQAEDARLREAQRQAEDVNARLAAKRASLDGRARCRYSHTRGAWLQTVSPRDMFDIQYAIVLCGGAW